MRHASGHRGEKWVAASTFRKQEQEHIQHFLHKTCNEEVLHDYIVQNNGKEIYKKNVQHVQSCLFAN